MKSSRLISPRAWRSSSRRTPGTPELPAVDRVARTRKAVGAITRIQNAMLMNPTRSRSTEPDRNQRQRRHYATWRSLRMRSSSAAMISPRASRSSAIRVGGCAACEWAALSRESGRPGRRSRRRKWTNTHAPRTSVGLRPNRCAIPPATPPMTRSVSDLVRVCITRGLRERRVPRMWLAGVSRFGSLQCELRRTVFPPSRTLD
jgi:hypothetical protein